MKRILNFVLAVVVSLNLANAYTSDPISIYPLVFDNDLPIEVKSQLESKLEQIISFNGMLDKEPKRFIMVTRVSILSKDIIRGMPQKISQKIELTFKIGDIDQEKAFKSYSITVTGIGETLEKSYLNAIKKIRPNSEAFTEFITDGKESILMYYKNHIDELIDMAKGHAEVSEYGSAIDILLNIPSIGNNKRDEIHALTERFFSQLIEQDGKSLLKQAKSAWAANMTQNGAVEALSLISKIHSQSSAYVDAQSLIEDINQRMKVIDDREWEQYIKEYNDNLEREKREWERQMSLDRYSHERSIAQDAQRAENYRALISAYRDASLEYARNQPRVINYNRILLW